MFQKMLKSYYALLFALLSVSGHAFATNPNTVIGIVTDENPATIDSPYFLAISPDGQKIYVSNLGNGTVSVVDVATNTVTGLVNDSLSAFHDNYGVVFTPNGQTAYVMNSLSPYSISIINTATNTVTGTINTTAAALDGAFNMEITPNGNYGYVAGGTYITVVDLLTNATTQNIILPITNSEVNSIAITPDGTKAYAILDSGNLYAIDLTNNTVIGAVTGTFANSFGSAITPNGSTLYIANSTLNSVSIVDVATNAQTGTVTDLNPATFNYPFALAITPDGSTLYVVNDAGESVSIVDTATNTVTGIITDLNPPTFHGPLDMIVTPNGAYGYVLNANSGTVSIVYISTPILPPTNASGCQSSDTFLLQQDLVNILTWSAPTSGTAPVSYKIYRDAGLTNLVATVPATSVLKFVDHNRVANVTYTYYIVSVDAQADVSTAVEVVVNSACPSA